MNEPAPKRAVLARFPAAELRHVVADDGTTASRYEVAAPGVALGSGHSARVAWKQAAKRVAEIPPGPAESAEDSRVLTDDEVRESRNELLGLPPHATVGMAVYAAVAAGPRRTTRDQVAALFPPRVLARMAFPPDLPPETPMAATKADLDQLDAILDRLDDHATAHPDPALAAIAGDLTDWYKRMFRPAPLANSPAAAGVQGALDRLDYYIASRGADPGLVSRVDDLKANLGPDLDGKGAGRG